MSGAVTTYPDPPDRPSDDAATVLVDGEEVFVHETPVGSFAQFDLHGRTTVEIERADGFEQVAVRPLSAAIDVNRDGNRTAFELFDPANLRIEFDGDLRTPVWPFANRPIDDPPTPDEPGVHYVEAGTVQDVGRLWLADGEEVYLEGGAVLRGTIGTRGADDVAIRGHGIVDPPADGDNGRFIHFHQTSGLRIDGPVVLNPYDPDNWTLTPVACEDVTITDTKILGWSANDDGIDVVGSSRVLIEDCFIRTRDDCVAVKATTKAAAGDRDVGARDVDDVTVRDCVCWNGPWGNALEIGYETATESIRDVTFEDCDIIHAEPEGYTSGGVFTIHNGDRAAIEDVTYRNLRVEDAWDKLIDIKIQYSRYSVDHDERGSVSDVHFDGIDVVDGRLPPSLIQGCDADTHVGDITIANLRVFGEPVRDKHEANLIDEYVDDVRFVTSR